MLLQWNKLNGHNIYSFASLVSLQQISEHQFLFRRASKMGPKTNKKGGKNVRPTLANSFMPTEPQLGADDIDKLLHLLIDKLSNLYPPQISNKQVMVEIENELITPSSDVTFSDLNKTDRKEKIRNKRKELRHANDSSLNITLRKDVTIGLKKCLRDLSANCLCVLIFDSTVNLEPMRCIFEKGLSNGPTIIGIPKLGEWVRKPLGFPSICLGFNNNVLSKQEASTSDHHFYPVVDLINSFVKNEKISKSVCDIVSKGENYKGDDRKCDTLINTSEKSLLSNECKENFVNIKTEQLELKTFTEMPKIGLLYRKDANTRVFVPESKMREPVGSDHLFDDNDFISLSESPVIKRQKME